MIHFLLAQSSGTNPGDALEGIEVSHDWTDWIVAGAIVVTSVVVGLVASRVVSRSLIRREVEPITARLLGRIVGFVLVLIGLVTALGVLQVRGLGAVLGALGILGIALAFALQDTLENLIAGLALQVSKPFKKGEAVTLGDFDGTVEDVRMRNVLLRTYDGESVQLPSATVWKNPILNHMKEGTRRARLDVGVAFDTDLDRVREVLRDAVVPLDVVLDEPTPDVWVTGFGEASIRVSVLVWFDTVETNLFEVTDACARAMKRALDSAGITIPYPQRVVTDPDG
ncbi:MAG: mechanosensitive ion channel family protein [Acidimicrobiia bacterium]|nr:mechanosensitive ion channel family protein [Acidimicrobiia bacterium]